MKLFLSSVSIAHKNQTAFWELVGKSKDDIRVALIQNGADTYPADRREWVTVAEKLIEEAAAEVVKFDLREYNDADKIMEDLSDFDVVWVGGGNTYYLRWIAKQSGFDKAIKELCCRTGVVYGGDSAGAIVAGPTIDHFQSADTPEDAPEIALEGFGLADIVVIPHYDHAKYASVMADAEKKLINEAYNTVPLNDDEAVVINGDSIRKI